MLVIIILLCMLPFAYPLFEPGKIVESNIYDEELANLHSQKEARSKKYENNFYDEDKRPYDHPASANFSSSHKGTLFYFDPNTISADDWKKLGLRDKTIATILNYRNKGGRFKKPEDIKKIWGLFPDEADRLVPYIKIGETSENLNSNFDRSNTNVNRPVFEKKSAVVVVDINETDTSAWIALPGIGSKLTQRIINFRNKLGGFYKIEQVGETYGLHDSVYQKIKPFLKTSEVLSKININAATVDDLKAHPYISYQLANAIVQYRSQHGEYNALADLKKIMIIDEVIFERMAPYLSLQ